MATHYYDFVGHPYDFFEHLKYLELNSKQFGFQVVYLPSNTFCGDKERRISLLEEKKVDTIYVVRGNGRTVYCFACEIGYDGEIITYGTFLVELALKDHYYKKERYGIVTYNLTKYNFNKPGNHLFALEIKKEIKDAMRIPLYNPIQEVRFPSGYTARNIINTISSQYLYSAVDELGDYRDIYVEYHLKFEEIDNRFVVTLSSETYSIDYNHDHSSSEEYWENYDYLNCYTKSLSIIMPNDINRFSVFDKILCSFDRECIRIISLPNGRADMFEEVETFESILDKKPHEPIGPNSGKGTRIYSETVREDDFKENWTYMLRFDGPPSSRISFVRAFSEPIKEIGFDGYERYNTSRERCACRLITSDMMRDRRGDKFIGHPARRND